MANEKTHNIFLGGRIEMGTSNHKAKNCLSPIPLTLIGLTFAGINFCGLLQPRNSKDFAGIYFRGWDFFKNFEIFADQILVMFFFFFFLFFQTVN